MVYARPLPANHGRFHVVALGAGAQPGRAQAPRRPNVLYIMTDQQRFDTIAAAGNVDCVHCHGPAYDGMLALTTAMGKAGSTKSEDVVKVLPGLKWRSLRGPRYIRDVDHQADVGIYVGYTKKDPKYKELLVVE